MYPPLSQFNATSPALAAPAINNINTNPPVVPAKRKRANTTAPAQPAAPGLAPRSYSAFGQYPPAFSPPAPPLVGVATVPNSAGSEDIHCICGFTDDDGYTIACDDCGRWSHMVCFDISVGKDPAEWRCWECHPRAVNRERAHELQARRYAAQAQGRLGPFVGSAEAEAAAGATQRRRRDRRASMVAAPPPLPAVQPGEAPEDEHIDIEDDWRMAYVPLAEDAIPHASTREKLRLAAQNWRGVTALSPDEPELDAQTKVVPLPNGKDDIAAAVRPPSYALQTTAPIAGEALIAPFTSTIIPSASYLADPLNAYAHMGMPKPHVHLVPPPLSVALDARMSGNEARFIRSGCRPNAVLRPVLCPSKRSGEESEPGVLKFAVFALRDLKASEEVVLSWEWDDGAVVHQLPALIEEGLRSGAGPSKMTPHHIERLRLQMQSIVESLKSSFVTCACGSAARDCAVRLMEVFAEGEHPWLNGFHEPARKKSPRVPQTHSNVQAGPSRPSPYVQQQSPSGSPPQSQPHEHSHSSQFQSPPLPPPPNRHPTSLASLQDLARYSNAKTRARSQGKVRVDLGPLVGEPRGVRTRLVGGANAGGMRGVQQVHGDRWDQFGELDVEVPEVRVEQATPTKRGPDLKGKGKARGSNGIGMGLEPPAGARPKSPLRGSFGARAADGERVPREKEEKMPPKMRKRWIQQKSETLRNECPVDDGAEANAGMGVGLGLSLAGPSLDSMDVDSFGLGHGQERTRSERSHSASTTTPTPTPTPTPVVRQQHSTMDVDLDMLEMPPPPLPTFSSAPSRVLPTTTLPAISTAVAAPSAPSTQNQGRRASSLFSLLNEHPVSPLHSSSKHLAQVMNTVATNPVPTVTSSVQPEPVTQPRASTPEVEGPPEPAIQLQASTLHMEGDVEGLEPPAAAAAAAAAGTVLPETAIESRDKTPVEEGDAGEGPELIEDEVEIEAMTAPSPAVKDDAPLSVLPPSREPTPTPPPVLAPSREPTPAPVRSPALATEDSIASSASSRAVSAPHDADEHSIASSVASRPVTASHDADESPLMLFKEELLQAAAELARSGTRTWNATGSDIGKEMMVDNSLHLTERPCSASASVAAAETPESETEREGMEVDVEVVDVNGDDNAANDDVDKEMHDARSASPPEARASLTPAVEVQKPSPLQPPAQSLSPSVHEPLHHSPLLEPKSWITPERDSYEEKQTILASASAIPVATPAPEIAPTDNHASPSDNDHLSASPRLLRPPSPTVSIGSSADVRPTPPPFAVASDNEHEHEQTQGQESESAEGGGPTASVPAEPPKIRRSMADYRQRKRKQREEEAAKAAVASPVTPVTPLLQDLPRIAEANTAPESARVGTDEMLGGLEKAEKRKDLEEGQTGRENGDSKNRTDSHTQIEVQMPSPQKQGSGLTVEADLRPFAGQKSSEGVSGNLDLCDYPGNSADVDAPQNPAAMTMPSTSDMPKSTEVPVELPARVVSRQESSPKREASEERVDFSPSPELDSRGPAALKVDRDTATPPRSETLQDHGQTVPPASPPTAQSKGRALTPQAEEDGEILNAPARPTAPPSKPRVDASRGKPSSLPALTPPPAPAPSLTATSAFSNTRAARTNAGGPTPPTQPRSFRDDRIISLSPPPRYIREPPPSAAGKSKLAGWAARERAVATGAGLKEVLDKKADAVSPVRRASSYVPGPSKSTSIAASGAPSSSGTASGLPVASRPAPPSGPRALRVPSAGLGRTQPPPPPRGPLAERVERDRSHGRERERERDWDRERDREHDRDRDRDRYSPPRGRHAGRGRFWGRGRR